MNNGGTSPEICGALTLNDVKTLEVVNSVFDGNYCGDRIRWNVYYGGAISSVSKNVNLTYFLIMNVTFNNCSASRGGAIYLANDGKLSLKVKSSRFTNNLSLKGGGAIWFSLAPDAQKDLECIQERYRPGSQIEDAKEYPSWDYKSHLISEDVTFESNSGEVGGAVSIINGNATFSNCRFVDNFASSLGGHIYTVDGATSLKIQDSRFSQTGKEFNRSTRNTFINIGSAGPVILHNNTLESWPYSNMITLIIVTKSRLIYLGKDKFYCPSGSEMAITNFTTNIISKVNSTCKVIITTRYIRFDCLACTENAYSLQRGHAIEGRVVPGFKCLTCPFGGNCTYNILAKPNFWGFPEQNNPLTLRFNICPVGYCIPPQETKFPEFNGCQGNRSGDLCGNCSEGYTETLYSTHCRPSHQCNDYWFWPVALAYVSLMALYFAFRPPIVTWIKRQILWFKEHKQDDQDNNFDKGYLKILFYFYQAANLLLVSSSSQYLIKANLIEPIVGLFNFKLLSSRLICPFPGLTVVTKQLFSASHVFGTLLMICAFYILHWGIQKIRGQRIPSVVPYFGGILQTLLLGYTTLATVSFSLLRCVPIGTEKRLFYDGNVVCFQWWQYILIAFVCTFVVPFVFVLLWGSYKLYGGTLSVGKFLLACIFPLPSLIVWVIISFFWMMGYPVNGHSTPCQVTRNAIERVLFDSFKRPEDGRKLSLSWESIMIGRRLILVMMKAFVSDPLPRLLVMSLFCFLFLLHHVVAQPFRDSIANRVETISLFCSVVLATANVYFSSFLSFAVPLNDHFSSWLNVFHAVEIVILCFAPAVFGLLVVIAVLSQLFRLAILICRVLYNFCWICYHLRSNQDNEAKPLVAPVSQ